MTASLAAGFSWRGCVFKLLESVPASSIFLTKTSLFWDYIKS